MIGHLVRKEFLNNIVSPRFLIGFVLCLVLIPFSILLSVSSYRDRMSQYRIDAAHAEKSIKEVRVYSGLRPEIVFLPEPLSVFGRGLSGQVGNRVSLELGNNPLLAEGKSPSGDNPFLASFSSVDFVDITAIVFSLLGLIFSYDAITREREEGTLKLQASNALRRSTLLIGKFLGIVLTLVPVLVFSFVLSVLLILFSKGISHSVFEWGRLVLLFGVSLFYLAVFVFLGLLVSSRTRTSVTSLVLCLFLWVSLVFLVPNVSANFAASFKPIQSRDNLDAVLADLDRSFDQMSDERVKAAAIPRDRSFWYAAQGPDGYVECYGTSRETLEAVRREAEISEPLRLEFADKKWAPEKVYLDSLSKQARLAEKLSWISPAGILRSIAAALCDSGLDAHERRMGTARRYREDFVRYLRDRKAFSSFAWLTPTPEAMFKSEDELVGLRTGGEFKSAKEFETWAHKQADFFSTYRKLSKVALPGDKASDFPFLDTSDMPRFEAPSGTLFFGLDSLVWTVGLLLLECLFLFALGWVSFLRYDVR